MAYVWTTVMLESSQWLGIENRAKHWLDELKAGSERCTGRRDISDMLLKTAVNAIQSINKLINQSILGIMHRRDALSPLSPERDGYIFLQNLKKKKVSCGFNFRYIKLCKAKDTPKKVDPFSMTGVYQG